MWSHPAATYLERLSPPQAPSMVQVGSFQLNTGKDDPVRPRSGLPLGPTPQSLPDFCLNLTTAKDRKEKKSTFSWAEGRGGGTVYWYMQETRGCWLAQHSHVLLAWPTFHCQCQG